MHAEIGTIERFAHGGALASYAGLVPGVYASGATVRDGRITRDGSPWLRWALVEVALHALTRADAVRTLGASVGGAQRGEESARRARASIVRRARTHVA